jgi:hypothetical protein
MADLAFPKLHNQLCNIEHFQPVHLLPSIWTLLKTDHPLFFLFGIKNTFTL